MSPTEPQFLYMMLILPSLFGLTLIGEGIVKIYREEVQGWISIVFGGFFILLTIIVYFYFTQI
ncbi:hypothetical protein A2Z41_03450 [Microgenomates group bacterium RBG_19FT_COMBO_39_10]|nr:MAG: hypothetical protein A2Z41_03450 [Microgenomates group bacterium RBG_19FT_COMBO_39_10]